MKIKKNLVAATAAVLAAGMALAGCGSSNGGSGDVQKTADGKVKITMWHGFSEADGKTLESIVDDFNKSQDKYEIDAQLQPWSTIGETMVTKVTTGDGPDFVTTGADNGQGWSIDGVKYELHEGESIVMPAKHPHAVYGKEQYKMLLVVVF